ncbi:MULTISPECIES: glyoxalase [Flavobacteriaceae]|uniref:glyoxalase n=1 Tax=Flavobacteriaceae TaxID=49546 RepID=UPI0010AE7041|nr:MULTISPECIES: glyoxalase [Flavobacteriaceae]NJB35605.1 glyoxalase [Croceivirga sp. JEA036]TKD66302.1 glyoxalase [Flavobacterium sp. ASW18X]
MEDRSIFLLKARPEIKAAHIHENMSNDERFQNKTLRPVIKLQNLLLIAVFKNYIKKHKNTFYELSVPKRLDYIEKVVQKDIKFRNSLKGIIIGQFTLEEYEDYIQNSSALNKRMMNMVIARLQDQVQLFDTAIAV